MSCKNPNVVLLDHKYEKYFGKPKIIKFYSHWDIDSYEEFIKKEKIENSLGNNYTYVKIPCKQCEGCAMDYAKEWTTRLLCETKSWEEKNAQSWFLTLTYDDEHLPKYDYIYDQETDLTYWDDGTWNSYLKKEDSIKFIRALRDKWRNDYNHDGIRFFTAGEYGSKSQRAHFHIIIFNLPIKLENLKIHRVQNGEVLYTCDEIAKIWGKGFITLGTVNERSASYVAQYSLKKVKGKYAKQYYLQKGQTPEFVNMSLKPGIGRDYYDEYSEKIWEEAKILINKYLTKPPSYFEKIYEEEDPEAYKKLKKQRKTKAEEKEKQMMLNSSNTLKEQYKINVENKLDKMKNRKRDEI